MSNTNAHGNEDHEPKTVVILVNGQEKTVPKEEVSYEAVVKLAYGDNRPPTEQYDLTVTYRRGAAPREQGELFPGKTVMVVKGMIFNVTPTKKS